MELQESDYQKFYENNLPILMPNSHQRNFRFKLCSGAVLSIKRIIRSPEQLQKLCIKHKPCAVYQTVSRWSRPDLLGSRKFSRSKRPGYKWLSNNYLGGSFVMDFDDGIQKSFVELRKSLNYLKNLGYEDFNIVRTGRGFHLWVNDWSSPFVCNPFYREFIDRKERYILTNTLREHGIKFDEPISCDTRRVVRTPNTLHSNGTIIYMTNTLSDSRLFNPVIFTG